MKTNLRFIFGTILLVIGMILSKVFQFAHYYTFFSIGVFLLLMEIYLRQSGKEVFRNWDLKNHAIFWGALILCCVSLDRFGIDAGYWIYPHYSNFFSEILKIGFEWVLPFAYLMIALLIGIKFFERFGKKISFVLSILIFVTSFGLITEYFNISVNSWKILSMPFLNWKIGNYFVIFQTLGYWTMAIIPYLIYSALGRNK